MRLATRIPVGLWPAIPVLAALLMLVACTAGPPPMALDEAKKITSAFQSQTLEVPPRRIDDVIESVKVQFIATKTTETLTARSAAAEIPKSSNSSSLAQALIARANARWMLGRLEESREDLITATKLNGTDPKIAYEAFKELSYVEHTFNNYKSSIDAVEAALRLYGIRRVDRIYVEYGVARIFQDLGDLDTAQKYHEDGLRLFSAAHAWGKISDFAANLKAVAERHEASLLQKQGQYTEAERHWRAALGALDDDRSSDQQIQDNNRLLRVWYRRSLVWNLLAQGRTVEAQTEAQWSLAQARDEFGPRSTQVAFGLMTLADIMSRQGRHEETKTLLQVGLDLLRELDHPAHSYGVNYARSALGSVAIRQRQWPEAINEFREIKRRLSPYPETEKIILGDNLDFAIALLKTGDPLSASEAAGVLWKQRSKQLGAGHVRTLEALGIYAASLRSQGKEPEAAEQFRTFGEALLSRSLDDRIVSLAIRQRLKMAVDEFLSFLFVGKAEGSVGNQDHDLGFRLANAASSEGATRLIALAAARGSSSDPALADLARREQDAAQQIDALYSLIAENADRINNDGNKTDIKQLAGRAQNLARARETIVLEIKQKFPKYESLIVQLAPSLADAQRVLTADQALVAYYLTDDRTYIWAVPVRGEPAFAAVPVKRTELEALVGRIRKSVALAGKTLGDIPAFDAVVAHRLYELLLRPVEKGWRGSKNLVIVPDGPLGHLPFSLLLTGPAKPETDRAGLFSGYRGMPWLARTHAVNTVPSVSALIALRRPAPSPAVRQAFAGFGDPWFNTAQAAEGTAAPIQVASRGVVLRNTRQSGLGNLDSRSITSARLDNLSRLPETRDEILGIAQALNADERQDVFLGRAASEERAKSPGLSNRRVIAFATHGLVAGDLDGLAQPALALSAPEVTGGKEDGLLTMTEILGLKLNADWVVLSACNTAAADGKGAEAISGLGRAFFYAGVKALLATHWAVETTSATALTTELFRRQAANDNLPRAEALRQAMLALIDGPGMVDGGKTVASYAHPLFWAPFALIGDGGGNRG